MLEDNITFLGRTNFRNTQKKFGIKLDDRRKHVYIIGKTGMGKTTLLANMAAQDIQDGFGMAFIDPHGEQAEELLDYVPKERVKDVVYLNPSDIGYPIGFNIMEVKDPDVRHLIASGLMGVFKKIWPDVWSARMEYILNNSILALLEYPGSSLLGINRMMADVDYRQKVIDKVTDPVIKAFWTQEFARYTQRYEVEATAAIQNKVGQFISNPLIRNILGQTKSTIDMRDIMDGGKILIVNLSKGRMGEANSMLLGALVITKLYLAAMSRVEIKEKERKDFFLYVDEFQNFATESFASILSEARKYRLCLIMAHQYITQMEEMVSDAVFGNAGTIISFRIGAEDGEYLEKEFFPVFAVGDFVNLPKFNIYTKLMIDGVAGRPFSAETLPPIPKQEHSFRDEIIQNTRNKYAVKREIIEQEIAEWSAIGIGTVDKNKNKNKQQNKNSGGDYRNKNSGGDYRNKSNSGDNSNSNNKIDNLNRNNNKPEIISSQEKFIQTISLKDATAQEPVFFSAHHKNKKNYYNHPKKKIDVSGLRGAIESAIDSRENQNSKIEEYENKKILQDSEKKGYLNAGEKVNFD